MLFEWNAIEGKRFNNKEGYLFTIGGTNSINNDKTTLMKKKLNNNIENTSNHT